MPKPKKFNIVLSQLSLHDHFYTSRRSQYICTREFKRLALPNWSECLPYKMKLYIEPDPNGKFEYYFYKGIYRIKVMGKNGRFKSTEFIRGAASVLKEYGYDEKQRFNVAMEVL